MNKVLIITYFWPPAGGPGVQRILKFVKYLPKFGWQPIVLTVANGEYAAIDNSLEANIPSNCVIYKTKSIEPFIFYKKFLGIRSDQHIPTSVLAESNVSIKKKIANWIRLNLFVPDAKIGWKYFAVRKGLKIIAKEKPKIIFSTSPPPTVHLIANSLSEKTNLKWIADFRDPWTNIHYYEDQPRLEIVKKIDRNLESEVITSADKITCISKLDIEEDFGKKTDKLKCINIPNGFDEDDFLNLKTNKANKNVFTLLHLGAVNNERNPAEMFKVIANLKRDGFIDSTIFQFNFVGKVEEIIKETVEKLGVSDLINFVDYLPHHEALKYIEQASMLILLITNSKRNSRILPGKTFEYLRSQKYILALGPPNGEVSGILNDTNAGTILEYTDTDRIEKIIKQQFESWHKDVVDFIGSKNQIDRYSRENLTKELVTVFEDLLK